MIRTIIHDEAILSRPSKPAIKADRGIGQDLLDTLKAHSHHCVGMAANMIGELKNIIAIQDGDDYVLMYNPVITKKASHTRRRRDACRCAACTPAPATS